MAISASKGVNRLKGGPCRPKRKPHAVRCARFLLFGIGWILHKAIVGLNVILFSIIPKIKGNMTCFETGRKYAKDFLQFVDSFWPVYLLQQLHRPRVFDSFALAGFDGSYDGENELNQAQDNQSWNSD